MRETSHKAFQHCREYGSPACQLVRYQRQLKRRVHLKGDNRRTRSFFELCVFVESFLRLLIEPEHRQLSVIASHTSGVGSRGQITDVWRLLVEVGVGSLSASMSTDSAQHGSISLASYPEMVDQHSELCTPVSDMVNAVDLMSALSAHPHVHRSSHPVSAKFQNSADRLPDDG